MACSERVATLGGLRQTDLVPPRAGEPIADDAARATGELMIRHLASDEDDPPAPA